MRAKLLIVAAVLATLPGCLSSGHDASLRRRVRELEDQLYALQRTREELQRRIDELEGRRTGTSGTRNRSERVQAAPRPVATPDRPTNEPLGPAVRAIPESDPTSVSSPVSNGDEPRQQGGDRFTTAQRAFDEGRFDDAVVELKKMVANPAEPRRAEALFLLGEAYYGQANFPQAIVEYGKIVENYAAQDLAPEALYKIALSYYELGYNDNALNHLKKLKQAYPKSHAAQAAAPLTKKLSR